ncbi:MAG: D-aminoacyl-tRNA deacylase [Ignavibacteriales bacterium]
MRAVVQRVSRSSVRVSGRLIGEIGKGFTVLLGVGADDTGDDARYIADKIANLRVFEDDGGKMNLALRDVGGEVLLVSQFTLYGDCRKGRRPSYSAAAPPSHAEGMYELVAKLLAGAGVPVKTGVFQAMMMVEIENDGPVTLLLDSKKAF